jgi:hypothetical protein
LSAKFRTSCAVVRRTARKRVDKSHAPQYAETGRVFLESAQALSDVADDGAPCGNAIALLAIHAAISYGDALTIAFGELKSADEHGKATDALRSVLGSRVPPAQIRSLRKILQEKDAVSYQGTYYTLADGRKLLKRSRTFCAWALEVFQTRP